MGKLLMCYDGRRQGTMFYIELDGFRFQALFVPDNDVKKITEWIEWLTERVTGREYEGPVPEVKYAFMRTLYLTCPLDSAVLMGLASLKALVDAHPRGT